MRKSPCLTRLFLVSIMVLLSCSFFGAQASAEMRIFELQHQSAEILAERVRSFVGPEARVAAHGNTLVVNASPADLADIAILVKSFDRARRMLRVTVEQGRLERNHNQQINASGRLSDGLVTVGVGDRTRGDKSSVQIASGRDRVKIQAEDKLLVEKSQVSQSITVMEGSPARISVGRRVPFTNRLRAYCRGHADFVDTIVYEDVDTGFEVLPQASGDMVELDIRPYLAFLDQRNPQQIVFQEMSSQVRIPFGAWYDVGKQTSPQSGLMRDILGFGASSAEVGHSVRLRVDPQ